MSNKQVVILLGPPGSGKGTQGTLLSEKLGLYYFETAKVGEKAINSAKPGEFIEVEGEKYFFEDEKKKWETGKLWSPAFTTYLVKKAVKGLCDKGESLLLAGSPRTVYEVETLMPFLVKLYGKDNIKIILMNLPAEESIFRNSRRRICALMRHPILYTEQTKDLTECPLDGSKLLKRKGLDDPDTIKVRLEEFKNRTMPLIDYLKENDFEVKRVDGKGSVAEVFSRNLSALK